MTVSWKLIKIKQIKQLLEHDALIEGKRQFMFCDAVLYARNLEITKGQQKEKDDILAANTSQIIN